MYKKLSFKLLLGALISVILLQACAVMMSRRQQVEYVEDNIRLHVSPTIMPPIISKKVQRLSIIYVNPIELFPVSITIVDTTISYLKKQKPELVIVDRKAVSEIQRELVYQLTGNVLSSTIAQLGKQLGADTLLLVNFNPLAPHDFTGLQNYGGIASATVELRLVYVEDGTVLYRTSTSATGLTSKPPKGQYWLPKTVNTFYDALTGYASAFAFSSLAAAFGENHIGFIPDMDTGISSQLKKETRPGVTVFGLLEGSPAMKGGLQRFDRIIRVNNRPIYSWMDKIQIPSLVTIDRDGVELDFNIQ